MAELATDGFAHIRDRAAVIEQRRGHMRERIWYTKTKNMVDMVDPSIFESGYLSSPSKQRGYVYQPIENKKAAREEYLK